MERVEYESLELFRPELLGARHLSFFNRRANLNGDEVGAERYNKTWLVAHHGFKTPDQVKAEQLAVAKAIIAELRDYQKFRVWPERLIVVRSSLW
jgi:hypothetical protein